MIIAIDENGDFQHSSSQNCFFIAVHLRQLDGELEKKKDQFLQWEKSLPRSLKNHKGEIKSSSLSDLQLLQFVKDVLFEEPFVGITPVAFNPLQNPKSIIDKHKFIQQAQFNDGILFYAKLGRPEISRFVKDLANWFRKLGYDRYTKVIALGHCITNALNNTVGHSISGNYTEELLRLHFKIDRIFVKGKEQNAFWHELLRNQLYNHSIKHPLPILRDWQTTGHPFLDKYYKKDRIDLNELFWKHCDFNESHENFEIRIADAVNTIFSRYRNHGLAQQAFSFAKHCILAHGRITGIILNDIDIQKEIGKPYKNPYISTEEDIS